MKLRMRALSHLCFIFHLISALGFNTKLNLIRQTAVCDRGFFATPLQRENIKNAIEELVAEGGFPVPTRGLAPNLDEAEDCPLEGLWSLLYTDAFDVVSLAASPVTALRGVYFEIDRSGQSSNLIDFAPRLEATFGSAFPESTVRARVKTRSRARSETRVGLSFVGAKVEPKKFLGLDVSGLPPLGGDFPNLASLGIGAGDKADNSSPGFYDILFIDEDLLILRQNEPGGVFVSTRVHSDRTSE